MEAFLELLKMVLMVGGAFLALAWLGSGSTKRFGRLGRKGRGSDSQDGPIEDDMSEIGMMGGLGGGEMDDMFIGRHALRRAKIAERKRSQKGQ